MLKLLVVAMAAGLGASAGAQPLTGLVKWEASADGGATWHSYLPLAPGSAYKVRATASWTDGATPSVGFAGASVEQIDLIGAGPGDFFDIAAAYTKQPQPGEVWTVQPGTGASAGFLKIENVVPIRRVIFGQFAPILPTGDPNPEFEASNPILLMEMDAVAAADPAGRIINIRGQWQRSGTPLVNYFRIYTADTGDNRAPVEEAVQFGVTIDTVIPSPGSLSLLATTGVMVTRRRR